VPRGGMPHPPPTPAPHDAGAVLAALDRRRRRRRQRPLMLFGLVAPILLLLFMAAAGLLAGREAINRSQADLVDQLLESDAVNARQLANVVQDQLEGRIKLLEAHDTERLAQAALRADAGKHGEDKDERRDLDRLLMMLMGASLSTNATFTEVTVTNRDGVCLAVMKPNEQGKLEDPGPYRSYPHYSWRDWFSGDGDQPYSLDRHYPPITGLHISDPYYSTVDNNLFISLSLPIRDPREPNGQPAGVLEAAIKIADISRWLQDVNMRNGFAVLLDQRRYCVLHKEQGAIEKAVQHEPGEQPRKFDFAQVVDQAEQQGTGTIRDGYMDPVEEKVYLAGYARFSRPEIGWTAVVQHDRAATLRPIDDLRRELIDIGLGLLVLACVLTSALWGWLFWTLRRTENIAYG
jgi:hypothetical protein